VLLCLIGCGRPTAIDHGFSISEVNVLAAYQALNVDVRQAMELSAHARDALEHGVTLTINLEFELRSDDNLIVMQRDVRRYRLRYLPLNERYQLTDEDSGSMRVFSRLRHLYAAFADINVRLETGPLPSGGYELRTRLRLDRGSLPAPMRLPTWFSAQWQHDSEWSTWPFEISA
jgi:hypothetical protein